MAFKTFNFKDIGLTEEDLEVREKTYIRENMTLIITSEGLVKSQTTVKKDDDVDVSLIAMFPELAVRTSICKELKMEILENKHASRGKIQFKLVEYVIQ